MPGRWVLAASVAAGAAFAGCAELLGRWCADPGVGWALTTAFCAAGGTVSILRPVLNDSAARASAALAALLTAGLLMLLKILGLGMADPIFLQNPLGTRALGLFVMGQAGAVLTAGAAAWTGAIRGGGKRSALFALLGAAGAELSLRAAEPSWPAAAAAVLGVISALLAERPWRRAAPSLLRARAFLIAGGLVLAGAVQSVGLLRTVWTARLHMAYPGGRFLAFRDDGRHVWAGYQYSDMSLVSLRDGVIQSWDADAVDLALRTVLSQSKSARTVLLVDPPDPRPAFMAKRRGAVPILEFESPAQKDVVDAIGGGRDWLSPIAGPPTGETPGAAVVFLPRPLARIVFHRPVSSRSLEVLRGRSTTGAPIGILLAPDAPPRAVADAESRVRRAYGYARTASFPNGSACVVGSSSPISDSLPDPLRWRDAAAAN